MENNSKSVEDIKTIRRIMEESTRFLSLSGLSGISAGIFAIAGALVAYLFILGNGNFHYDEYFRSLSVKETLTLRWQLAALATTVLILSAVSASWFSIRKAKQENKKFWTPVSKRLLLNLFIPLVTGGALVIIFMFQNHIQLIVPCFLIFYGLGLVNAGKFTYNEIFYLGIVEILTGLFAALLPGFGMIFWIFGFGILHIIYGVFMYRKYEA